MEAYLERCLESVINQSYGNIDIILIDDGSTDGSVDICRDFATKDKRITYIYKENAGLGAARNTGMVASKTEYITFLDADDWFEPTFIEKIMNAMLSSDSEVGICDIFYVDNETLKKQVVKTRLRQSINSCHTDKSVINKSRLFAWGKIFHTELLKRCNFIFPSITFEDILIPILIANANQVAYVREPLINYLRSRQGSLSNSEKNIIDIGNGLKLLYDELNKQGIYDDFTLEFNKIALGQLRFACRKWGDKSRILDDMLAVMIPGLKGTCHKKFYTDGGALIESALDKVVPYQNQLTNEKSAADYVISITEEELDGLLDDDSEATLYNIAELIMEKVIFIGDCQLSQDEISIYSSLADDVSRRIFLARFQFAKTAKADFASVFNGRPLKTCEELIELLNNKSYLCYGAGFGCHILLGIMKNNDLLQNCQAVFDSSITKHGNSIEGVPISGYQQKLVENIDMVIITPMSYSISDDVKNFLIDKGIPEEKLIYFCDYYATNDINIYFDPIITDSLGDKEILIDGGCLDFKSSMSFLEYCSNAHKIYAVEPNSGQIGFIKENIEKSGFSNVKIIQGALWSYDTKLNFFASDVNKSGSRVCEELASIKVPAYSIDSIVDPDEIITFIKLDVEGAELEALKGAENIIKNHKPKLAISVYHKPMDYIEIPRYIKSIVPEYKMYFRHYSTFEAETVLYCVVK